MYDLNDTEPHRGTELIPDGTFAKVTMTIRPGGVDGENDFDEGLLKASKTSDVKMLDCEFVITEGPNARRKFWQNFTVAGGKVDEKGVSKGWNITKAVIRAIVDSALGLDPADMTEDAKSKRQFRGLADLNGITFVAKIKIERNNDPQYADQNRLDRAVLATDPEWKPIMDGQDVPPKPSQRRTQPTAATAPRLPAWNQGDQAAAPANTGPAGQQSATPTTSPTPAKEAPTSQGPAWLKK